METLSTTPIPLTTHRMQFFPADYETNPKFCPKAYRQAKTPCKPWDRRLPHTEELEMEFKVAGVSLRNDAVRIDPLSTTHLTFKRDILQVLPVEDQTWQFNRCAIVGNSGVLRGSRYGKEIDSHDAVFRTNMAPTDGYETDVGTATTFDLINLQHAKGFCPHVHAGGQEAQSERANLRNSTLLVFEVLNPFGRNHLYGPLLKRFNGKMAASGPHSGTRAVILSPELVMHTYRLWSIAKSAVEVASSKANYMNGRYLLKPMSGFFAAVFGMQVCKEVDLYGFSTYRPNREDSSNSMYRKDQLRYHYFDSVAGVTRHHSFDLAFEIFHQLSTWPCSDANLTIHL